MLFCLVNQQETTVRVGNEEMYSRVDLGVSVQILGPELVQVRRKFRGLDHGSLQQHAIRTAVDAFVWALEWRCPRGQIRHLPPSALLFCFWTASLETCQLAVPALQRSRVCRLRPKHQVQRWMARLRWEFEWH